MGARRKYWLIPIARVGMHDGAGIQGGGALTQLILDMLRSQHAATCPSTSAANHLPRLIQATIQHCGVGPGR